MSKNDGNCEMSCCLVQMYPKKEQYNGIFSVKIKLNRKFPTNRPKIALFGNF